MRGVSIASASCICAVLLCCAPEPTHRSTIPLPRRAALRFEGAKPDGRYEVRYRIRTESGSREIASHYDSWAEKEGWERVPAREEPFSSGEWKQDLHLDGTVVSGAVFHWRDKERARSLRVAVWFVPGQEGYEVSATESPYYLIPDGVIEPERRMNPAPTE